LPGSEALPEIIPKLAAGATPEPRPIKARTVAICADTASEIDALRPLLPPEFTFARRINETSWAIGSPDFAHMSADDARQRVENMLRKLTTLIHVYTPNSRHSYRLGQVNTWYESGGQTISSQTTFNIKESGSADALSEHAAPLLRLAQTDPLVGHALELLQATDPGWHAVFDVLEFLEKTVVSDLRKTGFRKHMRTANHYRHLGAAKDKYPLPDNPPTLRAARIFAFGLLRKCLEQRLQQAALPILRPLEF
jgi:hypothetical protein